MSLWLLVCTTDFILDPAGIAALMAVKRSARPDRRADRAGQS
jgi:hypothetical protein